MSSRLLELIVGPFPSAAQGPVREQDTSSPSLLLELRQSLRSDEELAAQLHQGDADALTTLFKRHSQLVYRIARRILRVDGEAEDCVQQIFLDVFRSIDQFDPRKGNFKTWFLMFAYHRALNRRRSLAAARFFNTDPFEDVLPELPQPGRYAGATLQDRIFLDQALSGLQPRQRRTIELTYYEGLTAEEVASRTGESVRVVRHNLYRGLEKLRTALCVSTPRPGGSR